MPHVENRRLTVNASAPQQSARQTAAALLSAATVLTSGAVSPGVCTWVFRRAGMASASYRPFLANLTLPVRWQVLVLPLTTLQSNR